MDVVRRAKDDVARRYGGRVIQGSALFKSFAEASADPTVYPRAVDIVNAAVGAATSTGHAASVVAEVTGGSVAAPRPSGIANARGEVAASLRRLGVLS